MTTSHSSKMLTQLQDKPAKLAKYKKHNTEKKRKFGENTKKCTRCGRTGGRIGKYGLNICRQCFREVAPEIGFKKFN